MRCAKRSQPRSGEVADRAIARAELPSGTYNLILSGENAAEVLSITLRAAVREWFILVFNMEGRNGCPARDERR